MDLGARLLERLQSPGQSVDLLYLAVQNWIVFQRDYFDIFDEDGDPFTAQIFLIERSTGKYIHRAQGRKVDFGSTLDLDTLYSKLLEALMDSEVCLGFPAKSEIQNEANFCLKEFPYERKVAQHCQTVFKPIVSVKKEPGFRWVCPPCQKALTQEQEDEQDEFEPYDFGEDNLESFRNDEPDPEEVLSSSGSDSDASEGLVEIWAEAQFETRDEIASVKAKRRRAKRKKKKDAVKKDTEAEIEETQEVKATVIQSQELEETVNETEDEAAMNETAEGHAKTENDEKPTEPKRPKKSFLCNHCGQSFPNGDAYMKHQRKKRMVGCKECNKDKIITFKQLIEHVSKAHPAVAERYLKYGQDESEVLPLSDPRKCSLCDLVFNSHLLLYRHKEIHHELGDYRCFTCQELCLTYYDLVIHNYQKHDIALGHSQPKMNGLEAVPLVNGKIAVKRVNFECPHCQATFTNDGGWGVHMRNNHSWDVFECKTCDEVCHYTWDFSAHMLNFHPDKPEITCPTPTCSRLFDLKEDPNVFSLHFINCRRPKDNSHRKPYKKGYFQCDTCGKNYSTKACFDAHIKYHQGIERFKCSQCDYGTNIRAILRDHQKTHLRDQGLTNADTGLALYHECDKCGKQLKSRTALTTHNERVHLGIKKIRTCKDCGSTFQSNSSLYQHMRKIHDFVTNEEEIRWKKPKKAKVKKVSTISFVVNTL